MFECHEKFKQRAWEKKVSKKRILVLGGQGYLGNNIARDLANNHELFISARDKNITQNSMSLNMIQGDYFSEGLLENFYPFHTIVHAGSNLHPRTVLTINNYKDILQKEVALLDKMTAQAELGVLKKVLYISSAGEIYGNQGKGAHCEKTDINPLSQYGRFKASIEKAYLEKLSGICQLFIVRTTNPYGRPNKESVEKNFINRSINLAKAKKPIELWGDGTISRDFIYIDDFVASIRLLIENTTHGAEIFNVGNGQSFSLSYIAKLIVSKIPGASMTFSKPHFSPEILENVIDISKARKHLLWKPQVSIEDGISRVVDDISLSDIER